MLCVMLYMWDFCCYVSGMDGLILKSGSMSNMPPPILFQPVPAALGDGPAS